MVLVLQCSNKRGVIVVFGHVDFICDDRPEAYEAPDRIKNMTNEEFREAFFKAFGEQPDADAKSK
jgi:hypothetical protein